MDYRDPEWVSERLGLDRNTVYKFLQEGTIPAVQLGRKWLVSEKQLAAWLEEESLRQTRARREAVSSSERTVRRMDSFSADAQEAIRGAHSAARAYNHTHLGQEHLLLALADGRSSPVGRILAQLGLSADEVRKRIETDVRPGEAPSPRRLGRDTNAKSAMRLAERRARELGHRAVTSLDLLIGIAESGKGLGLDILTSGGITLGRIVSAADTLERK